MIANSYAHEPVRALLTRWSAAAVFVLAMHIGGTALALMRWPDEEAPEDTAGAVLIELAPLPVSVSSDTPDIAIGPESNDQAAADPAMKRTKEEVEKEVPRVDESPLAPDPEVAVPIQHPEEVKEAEEEKPQETTRDTESNVQAAVEQIARAPPKVDAKESTTTAAPALGLSAAPAKVVVSWEKTLITHLNRFKRYPSAARARHAQGMASVEFTIDRTGHVLAKRIVRSSGSPALDAEALEVLERASPLPAPPSQATGEKFDLALPIQFRIK